MGIVVIEGGHPNGMDLVSRMKFVDFTEWRPAGAGQALRASKLGVRIEAVQVTRLVGHDQARQLGQMLIRAADEAEKRGAPEVVMEMREP